VARSVSVGRGCAMRRGRGRAARAVTRPSLSRFAAVSEALAHFYTN
jgi:hypothetical protein